MDFELQLLIERVKKIAERNETSLNQFLINNNLPKFFVDNMKKGKIPSIETIFNFAEKASCSIDYLVGRTSIKEINFPMENIIYLPICPQRASAGIGKIKDESNPDLKVLCFEEDIVPQGTTHGIIIDGHSMEDRFFDKQLVFIQNGQECAPSDYGIFSVTDGHLETKIYCKQLMQHDDGSKYLHSVNIEEGDPDIDYKNVIDVHCIGRILT